MRVHLDDAVDADLCARADARPHEDRRARREECLVLDRRSVDVGVRADDDVVADRGRMALAPPDDRLLHDDRGLTDLDRPTLGGHHRAEEHTSVLSEPDFSADDGVGRDVSGVGNGRSLAAVLDEHGRVLPKAGLGEEVSTPPKRGSAYLTLLISGIMGPGRGACARTMRGKRGSSACDR